MIDRYISEELERGTDSEGTVKRRKSDLGIYEQWCEQEGVDPENATIQDLKDHFNGMSSDGYADSTISGRYYSLKGYYDWLSGIDDSLFDDDRLRLKDFTGDSSGSPIERKKRNEKEEIKYITEEEKEQLKAHVPNPKIKNELLIELMWQTGIRQSEAVLIEIEDINRESREIEIYAPKTNEWRTVYYQPSLDILLEQYLNGGYRDRYTTSDSPHLFISYKSENMRPHTINDIVKQSADNADIQETTGEDKNGKRHKITSHAIRHGHAVHSLKNGIDITYIKEHLGHDDISTTQQYLDLIDTDVREMYHSRFSA